MFKIQVELPEDLSSILGELKNIKVNYEIKNILNPAFFNRNTNFLSLKHFIYCSPFSNKELGENNE
ncbi:MAG: hypothetical protein PHI05_04085 [Bacilli bacterium]|nr:hypothetical protein [Bacilli bacterium]